MNAATDLQGALAAACRRHAVADLYVFGSRAREIAAAVRGQAAPAGTAAAPTSDVDVAVRPLPRVHLTAEGLVDLAGELEALFGAPRVDIVLLPTAAPFLALEAVRGELLFCADPDEQAEHELYVLRRAGDLEPFQRARHDVVLARGSDR